MKKQIAIAAAIAASFASVGRCVAPNCGGQGNTRPNPNTRSNRTPRHRFRNRQNQRCH